MNMKHVNLTKSSLRWTGSKAVGKLVDCTSTTLDCKVNYATVNISNSRVSASRLDLNDASRVTISNSTWTHTGGTFEVSAKSQLSLVGTIQISRALATSTSKVVVR